MQNLNIAVNDRVWPDFDVRRMSNSEMGNMPLKHLPLGWSGQNMKAISYILQQYATERSYPKVDVGQIWKQYLKQLKNYAHIWKLKHCANADADANRRRRQRLGDNTWQVFLLEKKSVKKITLNW